MNGQEIIQVKLSQEENENVNENLIYRNKFLEDSWEHYDNEIFAIRRSLAIQSFVRERGKEREKGKEKMGMREYCYIIITKRLMSL